MAYDPLDKGHLGNVLYALDTARASAEKGDTYMFHMKMGEALRDYALAEYWGRAKAEGKVRSPNGTD
jgi:hypothetical protein